LRSYAASPYNQSRQHFTEKKDKEHAQDYEERTWREKGHYDEGNTAFIPPMAFKNCIADAAKFLSIQIPGKGKATYTKNFLAGIMVTEGLSLGVKKEDVKCQKLSLNSDGRRGGNTRVLRLFPHFSSWEGKVRFMVTDDTITKDVFERVLAEAGSLTGIGQFRPQNGGYFGRFEMVEVMWEENE